VDGEYKPFRSTVPDQRSSKTGEGSTFDLNLVARLEVRPWLDIAAALDGSADGVDFRLFHRLLMAKGSNDVLDPGREKHRQAAVKIEAAKQIAGEHGDFDFLETVWITAAFQTHGKEYLATFLLEGLFHFPLSACTHLQCIPRMEAW